MERIGVRELRQNASKYLDRVKRGESIEVTERGVPVAVLAPVAARTTSLRERLIAEGRMRPASAELEEWLEANPPTPADPDYAGPTASELLIRSREEERY